MAGSWRSLRAPARSLRRYGGRAPPPPPAAPSPAAGGRSAPAPTPHHGPQGAPPPLSNPAFLCPRHHRAVHEEGYQLDRQPDGELRFRRPDGRPLPEVPPPLEVLGDPVKILRAQHDAEGLVLHARTAAPVWVGERLDAGWAIGVLHPLAR